jgi:hypothetical protein
MNYGISFVYFFVVKYEGRRGIMNLVGLQTAQPNVENTKIRVFNLVTQCIKDIEKTVNTSGLTMRDVGVGVEKYLTMGDSYLIELKLHM